MCGIVGYIGHRKAEEFLIEGLRRLEYRGYDSAGVVTHEPSGLAVAKVVGRIEGLAARMADEQPSGLIGIGHTRWATHGPPTAENAHPHLAADEAVAIVHNGVIENHQQLRQLLLAEGDTFLSTTDSEVIVHLIARELALQQEVAPPLDADPYAPLVSAVQKTLVQLRGTYGLVILFRDWPEVMIAARLGSPLVIGIGDGEHFVASDASPLAGHTEKIVYLNDHELVVVTTDGLRIVHRDSGKVDPAVQAIEWEAGEVELGGYPHYMLKEIFEQGESLRNTMRGRLSEDDATAVLGGLDLSPQDLRSVRRILLTGCGTSWHSALVGEHLIEELARLPVEVEYASELRYRNPPIEHGTLLFSITQSGETADTLAAQREMKRKGHPALAICNVVGSSIAKESDGGIYLHAGPEIGVASTKAYTSQCCALAMLALYLGRLNHTSYESGRRVIDALQRLPEKIETALQCNDLVRQIAGKYCHANNFLYLGRQNDFPTALEGALKLKEISYIHAEGYPAAEMKHGPIALVDEQTPSLFLVPQGFVYEKVLANMEEIKARGGPVIAIVQEGDSRAADLADDVICVPKVESFVQPIVNVIPLQLLAYHIAVLRGCDVDRPRNLAKSVTVE